jgi:hypothetical protein
MQPGRRGGEGGLRVGNEIRRWISPRSNPLRTGRKPGAETALFHYHPYFSGTQRPDGEQI